MAKIDSASELIHGQFLPFDSRQLESELGTPPVSPLGVIANCVVSLISEPVRNGSVLSGLLGQLHLNLECLMARHFPRLEKNKSL